MVGYSDTRGRKLPLNPKATASWLYENTSLTYEQIADFCGLDIAIVSGIADNTIPDIPPDINPVLAGYVSQQDIEHCQNHPDEHLTVSDGQSQFLTLMEKNKKKKYIPLVRRKDKPNAIAWLLKNHPYLTDENIMKLVHTTRETIAAIRDRSHWNAENIKIKDPVTLGICSKEDLEQIVVQSRTIYERKMAFDKIQESATASDSEDESCA